MGNIAYMIYIVCIDDSQHIANMLNMIYMGDMIHIECIKHIDYMVHIKHMGHIVIS